MRNVFVDDEEYGAGQKQLQDKLEIMLAFIPLLVGPRKSMCQASINMLHDAEHKTFDCL